MTEWRDSRISRPGSNSFETYIVTFSITELEGSRFLGFADWMPKNNYTDGDWLNIRHSNGKNVDSGCVLYWMPHPDFPRI